MEYPRDLGCHAYVDPGATREYELEVSRYRHLV
jgi:hypothetical protein